MALLNSNRSREIGRLDRVIVLLKPTVVVGEYGGPQEVLTWNGDPAGLQVRAELKPSQRKMEERIDAGKETSFSERHWRIRWREGIDETVVIKWRGELYDVVGIMEPDRDQYLELKTEKRL